MEDELENGVDTQEAAEPEQEVSEQEEVTDQEGGQEPGEEPESSGPEQEPAIPDSVWATARRRAEADAQRRADAEVARRCAGKTNPLTGKPITTQKEYWEAIDAQAQMRRDAAIQQAAKRLNPREAAAFTQAIKNDPEKIAMQARLENLERMEAQKQAEQQLNADLMEIGRIDPSIKNINDLAARPEFNAILGLVNRGYSVVDAFKVTHYDAAVQNSTAAGKQAARNEVRGKTHLAAHGGENSASGSGRDIPSQWLSHMRDAFPEKSMAELKKLYNQTL